MGGTDFQPWSIISCENYPLKNSLVGIIVKNDFFCGFSWRVIHAPGSSGKHPHTPHSPSKKKKRKVSIPCM